MAETKIMTHDVLKYYDGKIKGYISENDSKVLDEAKLYVDGLADNYDAAGTAQTKVDALANGQVKTNTEAIATLNGDATTDGSVAKAVADAKALVDADVEALEGRMDTAESDIESLETDIGNVDNLSTTNKEVVGAINEVLTAVGNTGTASAVTVTTDTTTDGALKSYTIKQGDATVGVIDIPKDMVVQSGEVVTLTDGEVEGYAAGTYIKLTLANATNDVIYVNVGTLVDIYKAKENAAQVQIAIDSATREISATIVAGSIGTTELADSSVTTAKIADANVTKDKLSTAVQTSLDKADAAATKVEFDAEVDRAKAAEAQALTDAKAYTDEKVLSEENRAKGVESGLEGRLAIVESQLGTGEGSVEEKIATAKQEAIDASATDATNKANAAETAAKGHADSLNTAMNTRVEALEAIDHDHANKAELDLIVSGDKAKWDEAYTIAHSHDNKAVIDGITAEKVSAWDSSEQNAKDYADGLDSAMNIRVTKLEGLVGDGFVAITNGEIDAMFVAE